MQYNPACQALSDLEDMAQTASIVSDIPLESVEETGANSEKSLSGDLSKLFLEEEERSTIDMCDVRMLDQDPADSILLLEEMDLHIDLIHNKEEYNIAKYYSPEYVQNPAFRMMFLRSNRYNPEHAANHIVQHFDIKGNLFGSSEILGRDVFLSDLTHEDRQAINSGFIHLLPGRDASGRRVLCIAPMHRPKGSVTINCQRALWYTVMTTLMEDVDSQKRGAIAVLFNIGPNAQLEQLQFLREIGYVGSGLAQCLTGAHYCYSDASMKPFVAGLQLLMNNEAQKTYFQPSQLFSTLETFGIPISDCPISPDGSLDLSYHQQWIKEQEERDFIHSQSRKKTTAPPRRFDIVFGKSMSIRQHPGNRRASQLVAIFQAEYEAAEKIEKTKVAERIVRMIHESHGRFLKWEKGGWTEVSYTAAREKISHFFRHLRSKTRSLSCKKTMGLRSERRSNPVARSIRL